MCVIVEFDEVRLGNRRFFPGDDAHRARWVPIVHENIFSNTEDKVTRKQFPLILAWALTHWKAQGMTL